MLSGTPIHIATLWEYPTKWCGNQGRVTADGFNYKGYSTGLQGI